MKGLTKKIITLFLTMLCVLSMSITAFAAEVTPTGETGAEDCRLTFSLTDKTNGIFIDEITITLLNNETNVEYTYTMTSADYLFGITVGGNVKQGNYSIALNYASKEQFTVQNADGTPISSFTADSTEHTFNWEVVSNESTEKPKDDTQSNTANNNSTADAFVADTGNEEADALWNAFLDSVSVIETDNKYSQILKVVQDTADFNAGYYEKATNKSKDEYLQMTPFEQFLWYSTYILPINAITSSDYDTYCGTVAKWNANAVGIPYNWLTTYGTQEMADAYRALMEWDYKYFTEHGAVMNFITGKSSIEENNDLDVLSSEDANGNDDDPTKEEIEKLMEEENGDTDKGIWGNTISLIKDNAITIAVLLILVGATIGVVIYRKRKAIDDDKDE